jgi:hypothetical protein
MHTISLYAMQNTDIIELSVSQSISNFVEQVFEAYRPCRQKTWLGALLPGDFNKNSSNVPLWFVK